MTEKPDAEWVRLEESWTAATVTPWRYEDEPPRSGAAGLLWVMALVGLAVVVALVAASRSLDTRVTLR